MTAAHSDASKAICAQIDEMTQGKKGHRLLMLDSFIFFMTCLMDRDSTVSFGMLKMCTS